MPPTWKTAMREVGPNVFAYVQATGQKIGRAHV